MSQQPGRRSGSPSNRPRVRQREAPSRDGSTMGSPTAQPSRRPPGDGSFEPPPISWLNSFYSEPQSCRLRSAKFCFDAQFLATPKAESRFKNKPLSPHFVGRLRSRIKNKKLRLAVAFSRTMQTNRARWCLKSIADRPTPNGGESSRCLSRL
jgi:hypothetical protein